MRVVAGVTACNEERTIGPLLDVLLAARPGGTPLEAVFVVSSACTDRTDALVADRALRDPRVRLVSEPVRRGKAAAINTYLALRPPGTEVTLLSSADVKPAPGAVEAIVEALADDRVGMAGGRPVPQNPGDELVDRMARLLWEIHHQVALESPKLGELVAFRSALVDSIDEASPVDEASIEALVEASGLALRYVPEAVVGNLGPATLREWLSQRRRIAYGHRWLERRSGYRVSTGRFGRVGSIGLRTVGRSPGRFPAGVAIAGLELLARLLARLDGLRRPERHTIWEIARSTKRGVAE